MQICQQAFVSKQSENDRLGANTSVLKETRLEACRVWEASFSTAASNEETRQQASVA